MIHPFRNSLARMRATLLGRIKAALHERDPATADAKTAEADAAIGDGSILEWLVTNLPHLIAELGPLIQAILTLLAMFG